MAGEDMKLIHFISFSGGRTSAYMTRRLLLEESHKYDFVVTFANTGLEHPKTLDFVHRCDVEFGFNTVWLEAVVDPRPDYGTGHRIVTYETADRQGKVFEDVIKKYGIPSVRSPHCTREMKASAIDSYCKTKAKLSVTPTAIGIRADEKRRAKTDTCTSQIRMSFVAEPTRAEPRIIRYPLIEWGVEKGDVLRWWARQSFDLEIEEFQGNCMGCFKKSFDKLFKQIDRDPEPFDWYRKMEAEHPGTDKKPHRFYRGGISVDQLFELHADSRGHRRPLFDAEENGGCSESCEFVHTDRRVPFVAPLYRTRAYRPRAASKLAPWFDQIGHRPHAEIAREAGVSPSTVYQMAARKEGRENRSLLR